MKKLISILALLSLTACGGDNNGGVESISIPSYSAPDDPICTPSEGQVQWQKLLDANAEKLSEYQLFQSQCNPTAKPNSRGLGYALSTPLFSDYTSKYRFVFIPENEKAIYSETEVFDFPVGSVLTKTFSMPAATDKRGYDVENIIETRLLIKKSTGWVARVYVWDEDKLDASRIRDGDTERTILGKNDEILQFSYHVPNQGACTECHQFKVNDESSFTPIGPKARYLNNSYNYATGAENQIEKWISEGLLDTTTVPPMTDREQAKVFNDNIDIDSISPSEVESYAKAWLDINCAHCHREEGTASNTAFKAVYSKPWSGNEAYHGACQVPVSGAGTGALVINPGNADSSLIYQRINTTDSGLTMPPIGRSVIHDESSALIKRWLDNLTGPNCN